MAVIACCHGNYLITMTTPILFTVFKHTRYLPRPNYMEFTKNGLENQHKTNGLDNIWE